MSIPVWNRELVVSWADTQEEVDEKKMENVKTLYVKNLTENVTEEVLQNNFEQFGGLEKVKKVRDFAFVNFEERPHCLAALEAMNGEYLLGCKLDVTLARPADKNERNKLQQKKEQRKMMFNRGGGYSQMSGFGYGQQYGGGGYGMGADYSSNMAGTSFGRGIRGRGGSFRGRGGNFRGRGGFGDF